MVVLSKRRGAKNLRLSILPNGTIRVSLPAWAPYQSAISFAANRADWIRQHTSGLKTPSLQHGHRIGKSYRVKFIAAPSGQRTQARLGINSITITSPLDISHTEVQAKARRAAQRALKKEAEMLLGSRLRQLSRQNKLPFRDFKVKKLSSRWGSCSSKGIITLNYFLVQLPWELIDYVIIHELVHTRHLNHSRDFWALMEEILPDAKKRRREIKKYRPILQPS